MHDMLPGILRLLIPAVFNCLAQRIYAFVQPFIISRSLRLLGKAQGLSRLLHEFVMIAVLPGFIRFPGVSQCFLNRALEIFSLAQVVLHGGLGARTRSLTPSRVIVKTNPVPFMTRQILAPVSASVL